MEKQWLSVLYRFDSKEERNAMLEEVKKEFGEDKKVGAISIWNIFHSESVMRDAVQEIAEMDEMDDIEDAIEIANRAIEEA